MSELKPVELSDDEMRTLKRLEVEAGFADLISCSEHDIVALWKLLEPYPEIKAKLNTWKWASDRPGVISAEAFYGDDIVRGPVRKP